MRCNRWLAASTVIWLTVSVVAAEKKTTSAATVSTSVELTDPAGDVQPIHSSDNVDYPGFDVVKLNVTSDGKQITFAATLKDPPGAFASDVLRIAFDTDNKATTGAKYDFDHIEGFEYKGELDACVDYADGSSACGGGSKAKPKAHWAAVELSRFKGKGQFDTEDVVDAMGFPGRKPSGKTPITGNVVTGSFDYSDLKVKSGQTVRLLIKESHDSGNGYFPPVLLKLK